MQEKFKRKATTIGDSVGFTVPRFLVKSGRVKKGEEYNVTLEKEEVVEDGGLQ